ncbi:MAG: putative nucleic acid-binding Zn-ribbon protein [Zhongshania sp.]|jgi:predicted  nucleic acid-binding Zn-ribbon protein
MNIPRNAPGTEPAQSRFDTLLADIKQERDELRVQIKLGESELKDEWEHLEAKWHDLNEKVRVSSRTKLHAAADAAKEAGANIDSAWEMLLDEIKTGYTHIRKKL